MPRTSPLPMELNPQVVFERLFGSGATPEVRAARMKQSRSILDSLLGELDGLQQESRRRATAAPSTSTPTRSARSSAGSSSRRRPRATCPMLDLPPGIPEQFDEHIKLHFDLTALAFQADITRVATLLGARDLTGRELPVPEERALPGGRHQRQLPRRLAPSGRPGADQALRGAEPLSRVDAGVLRREAEGRFRTATARCSITR